jgi:hypothetical protein
MLSWKSNSQDFPLKIGIKETSFRKFVKFTWFMISFSNRSESRIFRKILVIFRNPWKKTEQNVLFGFSISTIYRKIWISKYFPSRAFSKLWILDRSLSLLWIKLDPYLTIHILMHSDSKLILWLNSSEY